MPRILLCMFCILACLPKFASGDFVVFTASSVNPALMPTFEAGTTATIGIYAYNSGPVDLPGVLNFGLAFDVSAPGSPNFYDGIGMSSGFSNFDADNLLTNGTAPLVEAGSLDAGNPGHDVFLDFGVTGIGQTFLAPVPPANAIQVVHLANVTFDIAGNVAEGTYGFKFVPNATFGDNTTLANFVTTNPVLAAGADGAALNRFSITITAVPEPATLGLMGLLVGGSATGLRRFRRKKA